MCIWRLCNNHQGNVFSHNVKGYQKHMGFCVHQLSMCELNLYILPCVHLWLFWNLWYCYDVRLNDSQRSCSDFLSCVLRYCAGYFWNYLNLFVMIWILILYCDFWRFLHSCWHSSQRYVLGYFDNRLNLFAWFRMKMKQKLRNQLIYKHMSGWLITNIMKRLFIIQNMI